MIIKTPQQFPRDTIEQLLRPIPFYKTVKQEDPWQFEILLQHSRIIYFKPGETVMEQGEKDQWLYFLLKGRLEVYANNQMSGDVLGYVTPGEVFGDLAMLVDRERTAKVIADPQCREVVVFGTDLKAFGELEDFSTINLATKLSYYRNTVLSLRWKLDVYRMRYPQNELANLHHKVKLYIGPKDCLQELQAMYQQAKELARVLVEWNKEFGNIIETKAPDSKVVNALK